LQKALGNPLSEKMGKFDDLTGNLKSVSQVEFIDQNPIGRSSRSNPVTYVKAFDDIRAIFAAQPLSKKYGFTAGRFSFNVAGGRCDACEGEGQICVEMQFLADVHLPCEACGGKRFKEEILQVTYKGKNIADVLQLSIEEALTFFETEKNIVKKISPLQEVGLGYLQLGQSSSTLSGGEAQRIKLASYLIHSQNPEPMLFIFDEPTTGLHFYDIEKLLIAFNRLLDLGHSLVVIEHNLDLIKNADYVIDLGAEGGDKGGHLVFAGTPEELAKCKESYTGRFLGV
jgi:excinuclease ABC subunit A